MDASKTHKNREKSETKITKIRTCDASNTSQSFFFFFHLVDILEPFYDATVEMSSAKYVTLSKVIPLHFNLMRFYTEKADTPGLIGELCQEIIKQFDLKFDWLPNSKECHLATLFDPCYKDYVVTKSGSFKATQVKQWAISETMKKMKPCDDDESEERPSQTKKVSFTCHILFKGFH